MDYAAIVDTVDAAVAAAVTDDWLRRADDPAVLWSGDVETSLVTWLAVAIMRERDEEGLDAVFVDHGHHHDETREFVDTVAEPWGVEVAVASNADALDAGDPGDEVPVEVLDDANRRALRSAGIDADAVTLDPETEAGRVLLRSVPVEATVAERGIDVLLTGRRAEDPRGDVAADYVDRRGDGTVRVDPLLHMTEHDVWRTAMTVNLPANPLYEEGYRDVVGAENRSPYVDRPAWEQVLERGHGADAEPDETVPDDGADGDDGPSVMQRLREAGS